MAKKWKRYFREGDWVGDERFIPWFFEEDGLFLELNELRPFRICDDCDDPLCGSPGYRTQCHDFYVDECKARGGLIGKSFDRKYDTETIPREIIADKDSAQSPFAYPAAKPIDSPSKRKTKARKKVKDGSW